MIFAKALKSKVMEGLALVDSEAEVTIAVTLTSKEEGSQESRERLEPFLMELSFMLANDRSIALI